MADTTADQKTRNTTPSFAFEQVAARLKPFDLMRVGILPSERNRVQSLLEKARAAGATGRGEEAQALTEQANRQRSVGRNHALFPIFQTDGLVFPYNPIISEGLSVKYDAVELTHTNESFHVYRATDNVRISISNAVWTCDTFDNAVYAMSVIHFFRTYTQMDFGRNQSGRPPSPMWFSAYGHYAFHQVPVLLEKVDWSFPNDVDYVGIPEFGTDEYVSRELKFRRGGAGNNASYTWLPMKFEVSSISLVVQHSPRFWTRWSLDDFRSGRMLRERKSFHSLPPRFSGKRKGTTGS